MTAATLPRGTATAGIPLELIDVADNVRTSMDEAGLEALAASIQASGLLQPITLTPAAGGRYTVRYGHRRLEAHRRLGMATIAAIVVDESAAGDRLVDQLLENIQREDLNPVDEARALRRILDTDPQLTQEALATRLGWAASTVSNRLRILELAKPVRDLVEAGTLSASHAKVIAGVDKDVQEAVAKAAVDRGISAHDLEREAKWIVTNSRNRVQMERDEATKRAAGIARAIEALRKKGAQPGDPIRVIGNGQATAITRALKEAGYKVGAAVSYAAAPPGPKHCDCRAWRVSIGWGGAATVGRDCVDQAHRKAQEAADGAKERAKSEARQADVEATKRTVRETLEAQPIPRAVAEILLWQLLGQWQRDEWARRRAARLVEVLDETKPKARKPDTWATIQSLTDRELATEIAGQIGNYDAPPLGRVEVAA